MPTLEKIVTNDDDRRESSAIVEDDAPTRPPRAPPNPASVKINVEGAFIVDDEMNVKNGVASEHVHREHKDIRLPHHTDVVSHVAVDIGGSLAKLVYFSRETGSMHGGGRLNFLNFETDRIDICIDFIQELKKTQLKLNGSTPQELCVMATGGGAYKFYNRMKEVLHVDVVQEDEMECLIIGLDFFITEIPREVFTYSEEEPMHFAEARADIYPYLLVNIGSGVSMVKVSGSREFQRVGGTSLGGGTFWGILSLLTGARTFDEMLRLAERGDNAGVDMLVGDIYGSGYGKIGLKSTTIASTFGKVFRMKRLAERHAEDGQGLFNGDDQTGDEALGQFKTEDMARSLLYAISNNIGQIAYLQSEKHNLRHIYFGGSFIRGHTQTMNTLSYAIKFWSKGEKQAYFLRHEGYLGAVGAFLKRQPKNWGDAIASKISGSQRFFQKSEARSPFNNVDEEYDPYSPDMVAFDCDRPTIRGILLGPGLPQSQWNMSCPPPVGSKLPANDPPKDSRLPLNVDVNGCYPPMQIRSLGSAGKLQMKVIPIFYGVLALKRVVNWTASQGN